jgi:hypothetical protein
MKDRDRKQGQPQAQPQGPRLLWADLIRVVSLWGVDRQNKLRFPL